MSETHNMPAPLNVALIQAPLIWHDPEANRQAFAPLVRQAGIGGDLVLLPEMFTTGFTMQPQAIAEPFGPQAPTVQWLMQLAHQTRAVVAGSVAVEEDGMYFNRFIAAAPGKTTEQYANGQT
jgi:predicted amidohydrolase